jgi:hypothetical protein
MASVAAPLLQRRKEPDEEQLLKLFWNRAELKKELGGLRRDKEKLVDQLRQQESVNLRAQQRLGQLENLLADPVHAISAMVYYQLRGVWQQNRKRLMRLARELSERAQAREQRQVTLQFEEKRNGELAEIDMHIADLEARASGVTEECRILDDQRQRLRGFWNYFHRRAARERADAARATVEGLQAQVDRLQAARREKEREEGPALAGLSVESRRNINLAIIATAQQLLVHFAEGNVAGLAREAAVRDVAEVSYGSPAECQALGQTIQGVVYGLDAGDRLHALVRRRAEYLKLTAQYRRDNDTVPLAVSFAMVPVAIGETGEAAPADERQIPVNVLADEYWDIYSVLLN